MNEACIARGMVCSRNVVDPTAAVLVRILVMEVTRQDDLCPDSMPSCGAGVTGLKVLT